MNGRHQRWTVMLKQVWAIPFLLVATVTMPASANDSLTKRGEIRVSEDAPAQGAINGIPRKRSISYLWSFEATPRYFWGRNDINTTFADAETGRRALGNYLSPENDSDYASLYMATEHRLNYQLANASGGLVLMMDSGEIYRDSVETYQPEDGRTVSKDQWLANGQTLQDEFTRTYFIRNLYATHAFGEKKFLRISAGKGNPIVGNGLIYNDYSPFAQMTLDSADHWSTRVRIDTMLLSVTNDLTPNGANIAQGKFVVTPQGWAEFGLMAAYMQDDGGSFSEVFRQAFIEGAATDNTALNAVFSGRPALLASTVRLTSSGSVRWLGGFFDKSWLAGHRLWMHGYLSQGQTDIDVDLTRFINTVRRRQSNGMPEPIPTQRTLKIDLEGWATQFGGHVFLGSDWYLYPYALLMSGEEGMPNLQLNGAESRHRFGAFLSVVPYLDHTNIFFNGGLSNGFSARRVSLPGLAGRGVAATGMSAGGSVWRKLSFMGGASILSSMHQSPISDGRFYGLEVNQAWTWTFPKSLSVSLQFDALRTGDFFIERIWNTQTTLQLSFAPSGSTVF